MARLEGHGPLGQRLDLVDLFEAASPYRLPGSQPKFVRRKALDRTGGDAAGLVRQDRRLDATGDHARHVVLESERVVERAVEAFGPYPLALRGVAQLYVDPDARPGASDAPLEPVARTDAGPASPTRRMGKRASAVASLGASPSAKSSPAAAPVGSTKGASATENLFGCRGRRRGG